MVTLMPEFYPGIPFGIAVRGGRVLSPGRPEPVLSPAIHGLRPSGVLRTTRFAPGESVDALTYRT
jgi:hypothetical protein